MSISLALYQINDEFRSLIENEENINPNTGELTEEANKKLDALGFQKQDLIHYIGLSYHTYNAHILEVDAEIERLSKIKKHYQNNVSSMKHLLEKNIEIGDELKFNDLEIKYKKNPPAVDTDDELNLIELQKTNPELVKTSYSLDKIKVKELFKADKPLPAGIRVIQNHSLMIK